MERFAELHRDQNLVVATGVLFALLGIAGCTPMPIHRTDSFSQKSGTQTLAVDAKQRMVIFTTRKDGTKVTCAEPSPDALTAISSSVGSSLQTSSGAIASVASALTESASSIGLRTQSIQLLRDGMYRSCEAYAAGAIDDAEYNRQQRRYQNLMLSLLAIEQLSGATVAQQVALGGGTAAASVGESANDFANELAEAEKDLDAAKKALTAAETKLKEDGDACNSAPPPPAAKPDACNNAAANQAAVDEKQEAVHAAEYKRDTAKLKLSAARSAASASAAGATPAFGAQAPNPKVTDASMQYIAEATRTIVSTTLLASFAQEECARLWEFVGPTVVNRPAMQALFDAAGADPSSASSNAQKTGPGEVLDPNKLEQIIERLSPKASKTIDKNNIINKVQIHPERYLIMPKYSLLEKTVGVDPARQIIEDLSEGCKGYQLANQPALYTPQYIALQPPPLRVLGSELPITLPPSSNRELPIVGGKKPYHYSSPQSLVAVDIAENNVLKITRSASAGADQETRVYVWDSADAVATIDLKLPK